VVGAKFIVDRRCTVKSTLTLTGLIEGIKHRSLLRRISELAAAGVLPACDADARIDLVLPPEAGLPMGLTIRELQVQASLLSEHRVTCRQCPSSMTGHVGGCIAYVPYPISEGMEYLLWLTAARALQGKLPEGLMPRARLFAERALAIEQTPLADGLRTRGDLLAGRRHVLQIGPLWRRRRLTSAKVLDAFFVNGVLAGDDLRCHLGFLAAVLALAGAMEPALTDEERRLALQEDIEPYREAHDLMIKAQNQGLGIYVWP
jgi:hypothetical protein